MLPGQISDFVVEEHTALILHPVFMLVPPFDIFCLKLEVLVEPVETLLLEIDLGLRTSITDLLVLLELELIKLTVFRDCGQNFKGIILL